MATPTGRIPAKHSPMHSPGVVGGVVYTIGTESGDSITVNIQLNDHRGIAVAQRCSVLAYLSDDANGDSVVATPPTTVAAGTDGLIMELIADSVFLMTSEADGDIDMAIGKVGVDTYYLIVVLPDGSLVASAAITFA